MVEELLLAAQDERVHARIDDLVPSYILSSSSRTSAREVPWAAQDLRAFVLIDRGIAFPTSTMKGIVLVVHGERARAQFRGAPRRKDQGAPARLLLRSVHHEYLALYR